MKPSFDHTVSILVKAYLNDTLIPGDCMSCAVGNLIVHSGYPLCFDKNSENGSDETSWLKYIDYFLRKRCWGPPSRKEEEVGLLQINSTGYTPKEIEKIEYAFEYVVDFDDYADDDILCRLLSVVDVLAEIHGIDLQTKESAKLQFVKI